MTRMMMAFLSALCLAIAGCQPGLLGEGLPRDTAEAIAEADSIELISINPNRLKDGDYYGWEELGRATIDSTKTQREIVRQLNSAINASDGTVAGCFNPRHAVLAKHGGKTHEVIICFECLSLQIRIDGERAGGETITQSQSRYFNQLLADAGLPIAE